MDYIDLIKIINGSYENRKDVIKFPMKADIIDHNILDELECSDDVISIPESTQQVNETIKIGKQEIGDLEQLGDFEEETLEILGNDDWDKEKIDGNFDPNFGPNTDVEQELKMKEYKNEKDTYNMILQEEKIIDSNDKNDKKIFKDINNLVRMYNQSTSNKKI